MATATVREVYGDEAVDILNRLSGYAFRSSPPLPDMLERQAAMALREGTRYFAVFDDGVAVAASGVSPLMQNVRGKLLPMAGIHNVSTDPSARHRGHARRMLAALYEAMRAEGRTVSCLYPFRESFYERMGWVNLPQARKATFAPAPLLPLVERDLGGSVERVLLADAYDAYRGYVCRLRDGVHGMSTFEYFDWFGVRKAEYWLAVARVQDEVVGLMLYQLKGERITEFAMTVSQFYYHTGQGKYLLLQWIAQHIDQSHRIEIWLSPAEHAETWLSDLHISVEAAFIAPMGRVLDVAGIGGLHTGPGRFNASVEDAICPWNEGIWQLETVDGALKVTPAGAADCSVKIEALSALAYGTQDAGDFTLRGWGNPSLALQQTMRSMFPPMLPYLHATF